MICPHCERYLEDGVAFCIYCGQRLGKYADDASEGSSTINLSDTAAPAEGQAAASAAPGVAAAGVGAAAAAGAAAAPVAPASARESVQGASTRPSVSGRGSTGRLHSDDEMARRMGEIDEEEGTGKGRKVLAGVIIAGLAAAAIGFGAAYVAPSVMGGGDS